MNLIMTFQQFNEECVQYIPATEQRGEKYCKLIYSTSFMNMNGLTFSVPLSIIIINRGIAYYDCRHGKNMAIIEKLHEIEQALLTTYSFMITEEKFVKSIKQQMISDRHVKLFEEKPGSKRLFIRITGIWEKENNCGLSYKFFVS